MGYRTNKWGMKAGAGGPDPVSLGRSYLSCLD